MYAQCGAEVRQYNLVEGIIDHKMDGHAVDRADMYINHGSNKIVTKKTKLWHLCVEWKYGTTSWKRLDDLKEINPVEVAEYIVANNLLDAPDCVCWVPYVLKKRIRSVAIVTKPYHKQTHKFGIEVPNSWDDCMRIDKENGNTLWKDVVRKEMKNVRIAFKIPNGEE
jgi:hypothetical protein